MKMIGQRWISVGIWAWAAVSGLGAGLDPTPDRVPGSRPNVVFILADDLGNTDLGCAGSDFYQTPNIDGLAARSQHFRNEYFCCPGSFKFPYIEKHEDPKRVEISAIPDLAGREPGDHLTVALGEEAAKCIGRHKDQPFFLYLSFYAGLVEHLDDSVGLVLQAIREHGLTDNTSVIFGSDNGGTNYSGISSNYPLRDGKVTQYLGGAGADVRRLARSHPSGKRLR